MDVASPFEPRIAGNPFASGTTFITFTARTSTTLATLTRDWYTPNPWPAATIGSARALGVLDSDGTDSRGLRARYRSVHRPSATGEGRAS